MIVLLEIVGWLACAVASAVVASGKGRSPIIWFMVSLLLGPIGLVLAVLRRGREHFVEEWAVSGGLLRPCPGCSKHVWVKAESCPHCGQPVLNAS
jgi:hypothetical protein